MTNTYWVSRDKLWVSDIATSPSPADTFLGTPNLIDLGGGVLWASHDWFGSATNLDTTVVYKSTDNGETWNQIRSMTGLYWATLFEFSGALYLVGVRTGNQGSQDLVIFRSADEFATAPQSTIIWNDQNYHKSSLAYLNRDGYFLFAVSDEEGTGSFPQYFRHYLVWADQTDLMNASNWGKSSPLIYDPSWDPSLPANSNWLEMNLLEHAGQIKTLATLKTFTFSKQLAAMCNVTWTPATPTGALAFDQYPTMLGGASGKFWPIWDAQTSLWYALTSYVPTPRQGTTDPAQNRHELWLLTSPDLVNWSNSRQILGKASNVTFSGGPAVTGWQYTTPIIQGEDLLFSCRTSYIGADTYHNANRLTFHRLTGFRGYFG